MIVRFVSESGFVIARCDDCGATTPVGSSFGLRHSCRCGISPGKTERVEAVVSPEAAARVAPEAAPLAARAAELNDVSRVETRVEMVRAGALSMGAAMNRDED